jgi:hypothetical protein
MVIENVVGIVVFEDVSERLSDINFFFVWNAPPSVDNGWSFLKSLIFKIEIYLLHT